VGAIVHLISVPNINNKVEFDVKPYVGATLPFYSFLKPIICH